MEVFFSILGGTAAGFLSNLFGLCVRSADSSDYSSPQAREKYEKEERRKELKRARGEDTWMLPDVDQRLEQLNEVSVSKKEEERRREKRRE